MKLYHGTNTDIEHIDFTISRVGKDFGVGFYLTPDLDSAKRQANLAVPLSVRATFGRPI